MQTTLHTEVSRIESIWNGDFGNVYTQRNAAAGEGRQVFWHMIFRDYKIANALEIGCNAGANLRHITSHLPPSLVFGVDINTHALRTLRQNMSDVNAIYAPARDLPFKDNLFDLTFTTGVLIHQPPEALPMIMSEIVRCSGKYILCGEYFSETTIEIPYRGLQGALFKSDFGGLYQKLFSNLTLINTGFLGRDSGWDDITYWLFEKKSLS